MASKITEEEIIDFYKTNLRITLRKEDLNHPTKDFVLDLYVKILEQMDVHNLEQPDILACPNGPQEHMAQAYLQTNVFKVVEKFVAGVGLNDLKYMDILMPKRARTINILQALAKYYIRYSTIKAEWFEHAEKYSKLYQTKKELEKRKVDLKHSIEDKSMLLSSLKNKSVSQEKEIKTLEETFAVKKREADEEEKKAAEIKSEIINLKEKLCNTKLEIEQLNDSNKKLSSRIIESPEKIIEKKNELEKKFEIIKNIYPKLKAQLNDSLDRKKRLINFKQTIMNSMKELRVLLELQAKNDDQCKELEEVMQNTAQVDEEIKQFQIQKKNLETSIVQLKAIIAKENAKFIREKNVRTEILDGLTNKIKTDLQLSETVVDSTSQYEEMLKLLETKMDDVLKREQDLWQRQAVEHEKNLDKIFKMLKMFESLKQPQQQQQQFDD